MKDTKKRPTQADVARLAKVSSAVVSAVVSKGDSSNIRVGEETRERVLKAIKELGYVPNMVAQSLAGGRKKIIGLFSFESVFPKDPNDFFRDFLLGVETAAETMGYDLLLYTSSKNRNQQKRIYENDVNRLVMADGAILFGRDPNPKELIRLQKDGYRFVYIGRQDLKTPISYVAADYTGATCELCEHLYELGHRKFLYVGDVPLVERRLDREQGFKQFLQDHQLDERHNRIERGNTDTFVAELVERINADQLTAVLVEETPVAEQLVDRLAQQGKRVPDDISIAILGEPMGAMDLSIEWSGFDVPKVNMGHQAFVSLIQMIDANLTNSKVQLTLPCELRLGKTLGPAPI
ncbi:LacI family DNA-binding transcriptional regulator [Reinekea blandensis]|uniref:Transcriptional regulator, LacI family protein n=1 Tax=Reinekea blandensis MED297 TaxID=314283 RepID=A4BAU3_9GAMM|nr:LacI family DNA-binding transcriptional regulator [Reinekea blandensis]EAR10556.1 transcriptional regulator, LacI family protein [Reinekea sp. MED297] [Reinekea blandensis MED297]